MTAFTVTIDDRKATALKNKADLTAASFFPLFLDNGVPM